MTPRRRVLRIILIGLAVVLVAGLGAGVWAYRHLDGNIVRDPAFDNILGDRPAEQPVAGERGPLNILVLGDDTRAGQQEVRGSSAGLSDTTILLHVAADRSRAYAVSVPRDLMVSRPRCRSKTDRDHVLPAETRVQWNDAYAVGGPACTIAQFEQMTGIRVQHFVIVKFESFEDVVEALDGVPVCVPVALDDDKHNIHLPAGRYDATGSQALTYVRARYGIGDGTDVGRLKRQQAFLAAMVRKAVSRGTLVNPARLYRFLDTATRALVTDPELGHLSKLIGLARELKGIGLQDVSFLTMPIAPYPPDVNRLAPAPEARRFWRQLRRDERLDESLTSGATTARKAGGHSGRSRDGTAGGAPDASVAADGLCL